MAKTPKPEKTYSTTKTIMPDWVSNSLKENYANINPDNPAFQQAIQTLMDTASGNYLFGGEAFDKAVEAAFNKGRPIVQSAFAGAGGGGIDSGLAREAVTRAFTEPFAALYGAERGNQLNAAANLPGLAFSPFTAGMPLLSPFMSTYTQGKGYPSYTPGSPFAGAAGGALAGAGAGAKLGSIVPGIGTGIGAVGGALLGGIGGLFS